MTKEKKEQNPIDEDRTEMSFYDDENPEDEPVLKNAEVPEYTLVDVMRELKTMQADMQTFLGQVKALGSEVVKNNEEVMARLEAYENEMHVVKDAIVYGLANVSKPQTTTSSNIPIGNTQQSNITKEEIDALNWKDNQYGQWTFAYKQDGQITQGAEKLVAALKASGNKIKGVYGRDYRLNDKFLNRSKEKQK